MVFLTKIDGYQKMSDTNKNVTKMDMIIKKVYYIMTITIFLLDIMVLALHSSWKLIKLFNFFLFEDYVSFYQLENRYRNPL
jgi:hypothetical protein